MQARTLKKINFIKFKMVNLTLKLDGHVRLYYRPGIYYVVNES